MMNSCPNKLFKKNTVKMLAIYNVVKNNYCWLDVATLKTRKICAYGDDVIIARSRQHWLRFTRS